MEKDKMETYLDDNVVIPEDIKKMTKEDLEKVITQLEDELKLKRTEKPKRLEA